MYCRGTLSGLVFLCVVGTLYGVSLDNAATLRREKAAKSAPPAYTNGGFVNGGFDGKGTVDMILPEIRKSK